MTNFEVLLFFQGGRAPSKISTPGTKSVKISTQEKSLLSQFPKGEPSSPHPRGLGTTTSVQLAPGPGQPGKYVREYKNNWLL